MNFDGIGAVIDNSGSTSKHLPLFIDSSWLRFWNFSFHCGMKFDVEHGKSGMTQVKNDQSHTFLAKQHLSNKYQLFEQCHFLRLIGCEPEGGMLEEKNINPENIEG
ncbi:hypothetical protein [Vibrio variabilis]|uniref:hypothetical protein n=1 Tax=Vibrio variabilis TaxID=990271 RepID=UPI000DD6656B|nr:hypothetical protein [Vibrio variabilis]